MFYGSYFIGMFISYGLGLISHVVACRYQKIRTSRSLQRAIEKNKVAVKIEI